MKVFISSTYKAAHKKHNMTVTFAKRVTVTSRMEI